jgi:hypothetical protein
MRLLAVAFVLLSGCTSEAGADCPPVPQPGQICKSGAICIYQSQACTPAPEYRCTNGRFVMAQGTVSPGCDASTDAPVDAPKDSPKDSPSEAASDAPAD